MSFNEYMHVRNRYRTNPLDFRQLAEKCSDLKPFLIEKANGGVTLDFRDPKAVQALTIATAKEDFNLNLELSLGRENIYYDYYSMLFSSCFVNKKKHIDRLIPRIPQKLNYIHWIEDLIECKPDAIGIDIGIRNKNIHNIFLLNKTNHFKVVDVHVFMHY